MSFERQGDGVTVNGSRLSPGGFEFGVQGWSPGEPKPTSITFFLDGSAMVCDQHGHAIRGAIGPTGERVWFATTPPLGGQLDDKTLRDGRTTLVDKREVPLATHAQVVAVLVAEKVDWLKLARAGWPQLPYAELKRLDTLPPTPIDELRKIRDKQLRLDALRARREADEVRAKEMQGLEAE